jgi:hypothetical protein
MFMFVLMEHDLEAAPERVGDPAQSPEAWNMIAAFETRDHRFGHLKSSREVLLCLPGVSPELQQPATALGSDCDAVIKSALKCAILSGLLHTRETFAKLRRAPSHNC